MEVAEVAAVAAMAAQAAADAAVKVQSFTASSLAAVIQADGLVGWLRPRMKGDGEAGL